MPSLLHWPRTLHLTQHPSLSPLVRPSPSPAAGPVTFPARGPPAALPFWVWIALAGCQAGPGRWACVYTWRAVVVSLVRWDGVPMTEGCGWVWDAGVLMMLVMVLAMGNGPRYARLSRLQTAAYVREAVRYPVSILALPAHLDIRTCRTSHRSVWSTC